MKKFKIFNCLLIVVILSACSTNSNEILIDNSKTPEWSYNKTIYEANIRQFTEEGNFKAFEDHLPKLKKMGIGIIWLMPIHPIGELNRKGSLGSYYSVQDYKKINPAFGNEVDFKRLVDKIHDLGMYIIIDWVANHTAWDHPWTKTNKEYYTLDSLGNFVSPVEDWSDVIDLNFENAELRMSMIDALKYWIEEFDIDGYRCDVASMVPNSFWEEANAELDKIKPTFMLAEADKAELHNYGFDMTYNWPLKDLINNQANGTSNLTDIKNHFSIDLKKYPQNSFLMNFTTNHDENSWNGTVYERLGNLVIPASVLFSTAEGMPLVYSGQEAGLNKALKFFEKDIIDWMEHPQREVFTKIFNLKKTNQALWNGDQGGEMKFLDVSDNPNVLSYYRTKGDDTIVVVINLSDKKSRINFSNESVFGEYTEIFSEENLSIHNKFEYDLSGFEYLVFTN